MAYLVQEFINIFWNVCRLANPRLSNLLILEELESKTNIIISWDRYFVSCLIVSLEAKRWRRINEVLMMWVLAEYSSFMFWLRIHIQRLWFLDWMQLVRQPYCTSYTFEKYYLQSLLLVSMLKRCSTRMCSLQYGISVVRKNLGHFGSITLSPWMAW